MAKIPEDVMKAARDVANEIVAPPIWGSVSLAYPIIARAILAERERCAKIAVGMPGSYGGLVGAPDNGAFGFDAACWQIADAIHGGSNA